MKIIKYNIIKEINVDTYNIIVNNEVVDSIEGQGRCKDTISYLIMDRVYALSKQFKQAVVNVTIKETGEDYYYSVV
jgi:hypothetical protein